MLGYRRWTMVLIAAALMAAEAGAAEPPSLADQVRAERDRFRPLSAADLAVVRDELNSAVAAVEARFATAGESAEGWRAYLHWAELREELGKEAGPDLAGLDKLFARLSTGDEGLGLVPFAGLRDAVRRYVSVARGIGSAEVRGQFEKLIELLAARIESYQKSPNGDDAAYISAYLKWLSDARQTPELITAVRAASPQQNFRAIVSEGLLQAAMAQDVDDVGPVTDLILGTRIYGTGHTTGKVTVELSPSEGLATILATMTGTTTTDTVGYNGPVVLYSDGLTSFVVRKQILIDAEKLWTQPAKTSATTHATVRSLCAKRGSRMIERMAWKRVRKQKCQADWIASRHAEQKLNSRFDQEVGSLIDPANEDIQNKLRRPLLERGLYPASLAYATDEDRFSVSFLQAGRFDFGAVTAPPDPAPGADIHVVVHESMINNFTASALAGMILREERVREAAIRLLGEVPEGLKPEADSESWGIKFQSLRPAWVSFDDGQFTISIRGGTFYEGEKKHPGMDVTATYRIVGEGAAVKAVRQGDLAIFPPGFDPQGDKQLSAAQTVIRRLLQRRLGNVLKDEIVPEELVLPEKWRRAGKLRLVQWTAEDGWLSLAWQRTGEE